MPMLTTMTFEKVLDLYFHSRTDSRHLNQPYQQLPPDNLATVLKTPKLKYIGQMPCVRFKDIVYNAATDTRRK